MSQPYKEMLGRLQSLKMAVESGEKPVKGICSFATPDTDEQEIDSLYDGFKSWLYYSGDALYPVPGGEVAYGKVIGTGRYEWIWGTQSPYGVLRRDLLDHLIKYYEKGGALCKADC